MRKTGYRYVSAADKLEEAKELHSRGLEATGKEQGQLLTAAEDTYNMILNKKFGEPVVFYFLGMLYCQKGYHGLGAFLLEECVRHMPEQGDAWNNLGICYHREQNREKALECFEMAASLVPEGAGDIWANVASLYINMGQPDECIKHANKALIADPGNALAMWHKALGMLEKQDWANGWDIYGARLERGANCPIALRNYSGDPEAVTPWWDHDAGAGLVVIHGEQGLGDEVMFASVIPHLAASYGSTEFVFECAPNMHGLMDRSFAGIPNITVHGTHEVDGHEWLKKGEVVDGKIALGTIPKTLRRKNEDFPGTPYLIPDPSIAKSFRKRFDKMGPRPKIGIAWQGGVQRTRIDLRSMMPDTLVPILKLDADFISLQYTSDAGDVLKEFQTDTGLHIHHWKKGAGGKDMEAKAALISELDLVVSVCQTCIHMAGALGTPTWVLVPAAPAWRYGVAGDMPWYNSVELKRQQPGDPWDILVGSVAFELEQWLRERRGRGA